MKRHSMGMRIVSILILLSLAIAGCSPKTAPEPTPTPVEDVVIMKVGDRTVMRSEYTNSFNAYYSLLSSYGYDFTNPVTLENLQDMVFDLILNREISLYKAAEENMTLDQEELDQAQELADNEFDNAVLSYIDDSMTEITDKDKDNALKIMTQVLEEKGQTIDDYKASLLEAAQEQLLVNKFTASKTEHVTLTDEMAEVYFELDLQQEKADYTTRPSNFETAQNQYDLAGGEGVPPLYIPEGFVRVKHILVDTDAKARELVNELAQGADFDALMAEHGTDPGMKMEPEKSLGYLLCETSSFIESFRDAALALQNVGDYTTEPVKGDSGYHIIKLVDRLESRELTFAEVKDVYTEYSLQKLKNDEYDKLLEEWKEEDYVTSYIGRIRDLGAID